MTQRQSFCLPASLSSRPRLLAVACVLFGLSGCMTVGPDYKRPEAKMPAAWINTLGDAAEVANTSWWEAFGDADLNELIRNALEYNRDLRVAVYRIEEFDARLQISNAAGKPQLNYSASGSRNQKSQEQPNELAISRPPGYSAYTIGFNANWELDLWGRIARANESARAELMSAQASQRGVMLSIVTSVASTYVKLLGLDRERVIALQTLENRRRTLAVTMEKAAGGSATELTVERARAETEAAAAVIPQIEKQIATTEYALSSLTGSNPGVVKRSTISVLRMPRVPQGVPSDLLDRRPDVMAAEQALVSANARIGVAKGEYFPTISLTSALGLGSDDLRWLLAKTARTGEFTRSLAGPIYSAGRIEGDVREAEAIQKQKAELYLQSLQVALQEVEDSLVARVKTAEQSDSLARQVNALKSAQRLMGLRFAGGMSTVLDVLESERQVFAAESTLSQSQRDQFLALVSIYKAMGGGWMVEQNKIRQAKEAAAAAAAASAATPAVVEHAPNSDSPTATY